MTSTDTSLPQGEPWTLEQASQAMIDMAVEGAAQYADHVFLLLETVDADMVAGTISAEEGWRIAQHTAETLAGSMRGVGDRIADTMEATAEHRAEINRRREEIYQARLVQLAPMVGQRGTA